MHQIKIFKSLESDVSALERQVNNWLESESVKVVNMFGNMSPQSSGGQDGGDAYISGSPYAPSDVFLVVVYEK